MEVVGRTTPRVAPRSRPGTVTIHAHMKSKFKSSTATTRRANTARDEDSRSEVMTPHSEAYPNHSHMDRKDLIMARPMPLEVQSTLRILDDMMRHHGLKTMDLFHRKDFNTSLGEDPGNPTLSWDELYIILKKWGVISNVTAREVKRLVVYLDTSGDGVVDHQELTFALRRARRDGAPRDGMVRLTLVSAALQPPFPSAHFQHFVFIHAGENCRNDDHRLNTTHWP